METSISYHYRITKYNPQNRDDQGRYLIDEWISYGDIGDYADLMTFDKYSAVENKYIESIFRFMDCNQISTMQISALEKKYNPKHDPNTISLMTEVFEKVKEKDFLDGDHLKALCRLVLREFLWCKLENNGTMELHFGYDYYMYIVSKLKCKIAIEKIDDSGLFVEECKSPYFINKTFTDSIDIGNGVIIYNEFDLDGSFIVQIIRNYDWQEPIETVKAKTFEELKIAIEKAVSLCYEKNK